ncbi:hypothetical protein [Streptomyces regalis]|nr:hypothetical protein [Streptomyces regalis]
MPGNALKKWEKAREFALGMPGAVEPRGDWVEESYRTIAPKRLIAELDGR